ncbi:hypothetical protein [Phenylobacterium sp.]|uniref:hypothetical protein n=1 Tax=Phenylobacterium sp. TaxID=1871053 RepID=UPI0030F4A564
MLSLDDPRWSALPHAYGPATDVPGLLRDLARSPGPSGPDSEPFFSLWSCLCHQGDVYPASYAAVPHLVQIGLAESGPVDFSFFLLPAAIDVARVNGRGPAIPDDLVQAYHAAIAWLVDCGFAHRHEAWSEDMAIAVAAAQAVAKGHHALAEALMNLDEHLIAEINQQNWG